jgi:hypothetical protein
MALPLSNYRKDPPHVIFKIPLEYLGEFTDAPYDAMRDFLAIPAVVKDALFPNPRVLEDRFDKLRKDPVIEENLYRWVNGKIDSPKNYNIFNEHLLPPDNSAAYFIHIDLSIAEDATGFSMVHRDPHTGRFILDFIFAVEATKVIEKRIPIGKMKFLAIYLKYNLGYNISKVTYDGFQSAESIQELIDNGIDACVQSVDRTAAPYDTLRDIIHSDQLSFYDYTSEMFKKTNRSLRRELLNLTKDTKTGKVDHITKGSKDVSDALCGSIFICASQNFEYQGLNDVTLAKDSDMSNVEDPYNWDDYSESQKADLSELNTNEDYEEDKYIEDSKFYGDDF